MRTYPQAIRDEAVIYYERGHTFADTRAKYGMAESTFFEWKKRFDQEHPLADALSGNSNAARKQRRHLEKLALELEVLQQCPCGAEASVDEKVDTVRSLSEKYSTRVLCEALGLPRGTYGSITRAAQELFVTQQTLSRQIMVLEQELGTILFVRGRNLELTPNGEKCLPEAKKIVGHCNRLQRYASVEQIGLRGTLTIGYPRGLRMDLLYNGLKQYSQRNPYVEIDYHADMFNTLLADFEEDRLDIAFVGQNMAKNVKNASSFVVMYNQRCVIIAEDHPLANRDSIHLAELAKEPFIMLERRGAPDSVDHQIELCRQNGFSPIIAGHVMDASDLKLLVGMGKGVAFYSNLDIGDTYGIKKLFASDDSDS